MAINEHAVISRLLQHNPPNFGHSATSVISWKLSKLSY
jgi:hypothetical protein